MSVLQLWLQGCIPGYSTELDRQFHFRPGNQSGRQDWDWGWHTNYFATKLHRAHARALTHLIPSTPLVLCHHPLQTDVRYGAQG